MHAALLDARLPGQLSLDRYATPMGDLLLASDAAGCLRMVDLKGDEAFTTRYLRGRYGASVELVWHRAPVDVRRLLDEYFDGRLAALDEIACEADGTPFQKEVWQALRKIPAGQTLSYGALAAQIGRPNAMRAVGLANGTNPIPIVIPCHRVIGANGTLTGYGGGLERKRWLLAHEGRFAPLLS